MKGRAPHDTARNDLENGDGPQPVDQARGADIDTAGDKTCKENACS
jgi:hypothetical protein